MIETKFPEQGQELERRLAKKRICIGTPVQVITHGRERYIGFYAGAQDDTVVDIKELTETEGLAIQLSPTSFIPTAENEVGAIDNSQTETQIFVNDIDYLGEIIVDIPKRIWDFSPKPPQT
jgi:hypothetical protein